MLYAYTLTKIGEYTFSKTNLTFISPFDWYIINVIFFTFLFKILFKIDKTDSLESCKITKTYLTIQFTPQNMSHINDTNIDKISQMGGYYIFYNDNHKEVPEIFVQFQLNFKDPIEAE